MPDFTKYDPLQDPAPVKLDWRNDSSGKECTAKIYRLLTQADSTSSVTMTLFGSKVQKHDPATDTYVHVGKTTIKKVNTNPGDAYYPQLAHVAVGLLEILDKQEPFLKRRFGYHLKGARFSAGQAERLWMDIALTIREHPFALGVVSDSEGLVSTPHGWRLEVINCMNILEYLNSDRSGAVPAGCQRTVLSNTAAISIPPTVVRLSLRSGTQSGVDDLRAVLVLEHRNIKMTLDIANRKGNWDFKRILVVMVNCPSYDNELSLTQLDRWILRHSQPGIPSSFEPRYGSS
jgi:hypothetical protein